MINSGISNILNRVCGFKPYKIANQTGWIKEVCLRNGAQKIYQKLPSGTVIKKHINSDGIVYSKKILRSDGTEIYSYLTNLKGKRNVFVAKKNENGFKVLVKTIYCLNKKFFVSDKFPFFKKHLFDSSYKLKMKLGF